MKKKKTIEELRNEFKELKTKYAELGEEINRGDDRKSIEYFKFIEKLRRLDDILNIKTDNRIGVKKLKKSVDRFIDKNNLRISMFRLGWIVAVSIGVSIEKFISSLPLSVTVRKKRGN